MPRFREIEGREARYHCLLGGATLFLITGLLGGYYMEYFSHHTTGMSNRVVWGMPHVFAIFLIVAASDALNVASIASALAASPWPSGWSP
jgi:molybdopterin-containing oxidoreductase family membrane subunit